MAAASSLLKPFMFLKVGVIVALAACALGLAYKMWLWLTVAVGPQSRGISPGQRAKEALGSFVGALFSRRLGAHAGSLLHGWHLAAPGLATQPPDLADPYPHLRGLLGPANHARHG